MMSAHRNEYDKSRLTCGIVTSVAIIAMAPLSDVHAQDAGGDSSQGVLEEVIVTGTPGGGEVRKLDASFSITTADAGEIAKFAPKSTADLLKIVPGVWAESSGGVSGANVFVRGFPGGGDAPFLTVQLNGSPVFPPPTLSFLENTTLFRIDETVARVEALRGGPNPVFSNGQPGLTTNFILKEGSEETEGLVKFSTSDYDLRRFDAVLSGQIADELYYMIGGYISSSPGIRDAGFNAEEGQQFTINLTKDLDDGTVNVYHRATDDHGTWYLPAGLNVPGIDGDYTQVGTLNRQRQILFDNNQGDATVAPRAKTLDLGEGRGWDGSITGGSIRFEFANDWELVDRFNYTSGDADTLGLVPGGAAVNVGSVAVGGLLDAGNPDTMVTAALTGAVTGRSIAASEFVQQFGAWEVRKDIESFTNDISIAKPFEGGKVTVGLYSANASTDEFWSLGNAKYHVVGSGGEMVTGVVCNAATFDSCNFNYDIDATGDVTTNALYGAVEWDATDQLTLDFGARFESHEVEYSVDEGLDGIVTLSVATDEDEFSWTAAANYALNDNMGIFGRINTGSKMPYFDDYRDNRDSFRNANNLVVDVDQFEIGFKYATDYYSIYATGFYTEVDPSFFVALAGVTPGIASTNEALGLEIDGNYFHRSGFSVNLNATIQESEIKGTADDGNEVQRQPGWQFRVSPSYDFVVGDADVTVYGTLTAVDDRFSNNANTVKLDGYEKVDLGAIVIFDDRLSFQLAADNLTDEDGLTEGDPRNPSAPNGRFIMPRSVKFSVGYGF